MSSVPEKELKTPPREVIAPLERVIASTIAAPNRASLTGWVYAEPQCVGTTSREWTVFARHHSGHGVMGRGKTAEAAVQDANAKALLAVPLDEAAQTVAFEESEKAEKQRDTLVSHLKAVMATKIQDELLNESDDWKRGFNKGCLFLLEEIESLGNR